MGGVVRWCSSLTAVVRVRFLLGTRELSLFDVLFSPLPRGFFSGFPTSVKINMVS
jgi:hypothetical protein